MAEFALFRTNKDSDRGRIHIEDLCDMRYDLEKTPLCSLKFSSSDHQFFEVSDEEFLDEKFENRRVCKSCLIAFSKIHESEIHHQNPKVLEKILELSNSYYYERISNVERLKFINSYKK